MGYEAGETNLVPQLAESYEIVDDGTGYVLQAAKGRRLHRRHAL
jgi:hypothetical protein